MAEAPTHFFPERPPDLARWAHWCLNGLSRVYCNQHVIPCTTGVQQGDPLGPALFCPGTSRCYYEQLIANPAIRQIWVLNDGILWHSERKRPSGRRGTVYDVKRACQNQVAHQHSKMRAVPSSEFQHADFGNIPHEPFLYCGRLPFKLLWRERGLGNAGNLPPSRV